MVGIDETPVRTDQLDMLLCTAKMGSDGQMKLITRNGKKEDTMSVDRFLTKVYGRPVAVMFI